MEDRNQQKRRYFAKRGRPVETSTLDSTTKPANSKVPVLLCELPVVADMALSSGVQTMKLKIKLWNNVDLQHQQQFLLSQPAQVLTPDQHALNSFEENIRFLASKGFRGVRNSLLMDIFRHMDFPSLITCERVCRKFRTVLTEFLPEYRKKGVVIHFVEPSPADGQFRGPFVYHKTAYASMGPYIRVLLILGAEEASLSADLPTVTEQKRGNGPRSMPKRVAKTVMTEAVTAKAVTVSKAFSRPEFDQPSKQQCLSIGQIVRYFWPRPENVRPQSTVVIRSVTFNIGIFGSGLWSALQRVQRLVLQNVYLYGVYMFLLYDSISPSTDSPLNITQADMMPSRLFAENESMDGGARLRKFSSVMSDVDEFLQLLAPALQEAMPPVSGSDRKTLKQRIAQRWQEDTLRTFDMLDRLLRRHEPQLCGGDDIKIPHVNDLQFGTLKPLTLRLLAWWEYAMVEADRVEQQGEEESS
ncbi:hypothetical protein RvY_08308 [Ramazzottius varieornatus]|uniref:F-box domain-containing protein n=1 Tax=Ramazzottius varieornatus TaxID=947166 RepID=A0A1D1VA28_RAMVA|nr:hypothetical protein RvY_08308 [Ramazzottius varieornatus]